jgi:hypothetical protein
MKPSELPVRRPNATYVLPAYKLVYVSTPKAACTSIKWLLADLQGVIGSKFTSTLSGETSRGTTIHRHRWAWGPDTPRLNDLDEAQLAEIHPDNGWFTFTMTRHPGDRLWSAWQSKFLLREPRFAVQFKGQPWIPRIPESTDDVIEDWEAFVRSLRTDKAGVLNDIHFAQQSALVNVGVTPYDVIYDTSQFNQMLADVSAHLRKHDWTGTLQPVKSNETPLRALERAFPEHVLETVSRIYADDFVKLDYEGPRPPRLRTEDYSKDVLAATGIIAERGERIGDLSRRARRLDAELGVFRQEKKAQEESGNN